MSKHNNSQLIKQRITTKVGEVPVVYWLPENKSGSIIVAFHYQTGNKEIWVDGAFEKLFSYAVQSQSTFIACDIYGHGEWAVDNFDQANVSDELWDGFVENSASGITAAITSILEKQQLLKNKLLFVGCSVGCLVALETIKRGLKPSALVLSSPLPEKQYDEPTSFHNNLSYFKDLPLLMLTGENDDEVPQGEVQWFFNVVDSANKELVIYPSGHDLPAQWLDKTIQFIKSV